MFEKFFKKQKMRKDAINKSRESFVSWMEISNSLGWKSYEEELNKKIDAIRSKIENDMTLTGEDLKRLQLALQAYKEVQRIPKKLEENAKKGVK